MRARNIKPDFFRDAELSEVTIEARYLFIGLWCLADREGKLKDKPKQIRFEIFPETKTKDDIETLLNALVEHGLIVRYEIELIKYIKVVNFLKHQSPHHTEMQSKYPDPPCVTVSHREPPEISSDIPLIPDSLIPDSLIPEVKDLSVSPTPTPPLNGLRPDSLAKLWNERAPKQLSRVHLPLRRKPKDLEKIKTALRLNPDLVWWQNVFDRIRESAFLCGSNKRGWKASFDFVVDKAELILDGKYSDGSTGSQPGIAAWLAREQEKDRLNDS